MDVLPYLVGDNIKYLREKLNWSREECAHKMGKDESYLGRLERGDQNSKLSSLDTVADTLGVHLYELFCERGADEAHQYELLETFLRNNLPAYDEDLPPQDAFDSIGSCLLDKMTLQDMERGLYGIERASFIVLPYIPRLSDHQFVRRNTYSLCCTYTYFGKRGVNAFTIADITADQEKLTALAKLLSKMQASPVHIPYILTDYFEVAPEDEL